MKAKINGEKINLEGTYYEMAMLVTILDLHIKLKPDDMFTQYVKEIVDVLSNPIKE